MSEEEMKTEEDAPRVEPITNREIPEGEAYHPGLLPEMDSRCLPQGRTSSLSREHSADDLYGKLMNIGLTVSVESIGELYNAHGSSAITAFTEEASRDFHKRLIQSIVSEGIPVDDITDADIEGIELQVSGIGFDIVTGEYKAPFQWQKVYDGLKDEDGKRIGDPKTCKVPGYHWTFKSGGIDAELVEAEAEGGMPAVMQRIGEIIGDRS